MNAGDKAFFYHSNCKEPAIVGIMEIVKEFSEDRKPLLLHALCTCSPARNRTPTRDTVLRPLVHQGKAQVGSRARRVPQKVCRTNRPQGTSRAGQAGRAAGEYADAETVEAECEQDKKAKDAGLEHEE
ncbi:hypothetical protein AUP68_02613 [Ilyonectria robusta]